MIASRRQCVRRGATAPFTAVLMVPILGMVAFAVDIGYICWTQAELQNAADAAALAGASQLMLPTISSTTTNALAQQAIISARTEAQTYAGYNRAGSVNLNLPATDVIVGYQGASSSSTLTAWNSSQPFPNAVQVTTRRDSTANSSLSLFFAPILGVKQWNGTATAVATYQASKYAVTGFKSTSGGVNPKLLPIGVDINYWNTFVTTGRSPDGTRSDSFTVRMPSSTVQPPVNVSSGGDDVPELKDVYPNKSSPGNFGLVNLNFTKPQNSTPPFSSWILNGPTAADMQSFGSSGFQATASSPRTVKGGPGLKSSLVTDFAAIVGQPRVVPLFSSYSGNGSNTNYTIVGFAGVTIVSATGRGSNIEIVFQPTIVIDPTATTTTTSTGSAQFIYPASPLALSY